MRKTRMLAILTSLCLCAAGCFSAVADTAYNEALRLRIPGDADGDAAVSTTDARLMLQHAAGKIGDDALDVAGADIDGDGKLTTDDARAALQAVAGKMNFPFPCDFAYSVLAQEPTGEAIPYRLLTLEESAVTVPYTAEKNYGPNVYIAQTPVEWQYLSRVYRLAGDDQSGTGNRWNVDLQKESLLVVSRKLIYLEYFLEIKSITKNGHCLQIVLHDNTDAELVSESLHDMVGVIALSKEALADVDRVAVYVESEMFA